MDENEMLASIMRRLIADAHEHGGGYFALRGDASRGFGEVVVDGYVNVSPEEADLLARLMEEADRG